MTRDRWPWSFYLELIYRQKRSPNEIEHSWKTVKTPSSRQVVQTKNQPAKTIMYCRNRWPHHFLLLLLLPIWRDEWISSSSNFSSLSQVFIYPFFFSPLLFSLPNPSQPSSFRPIRHTLIFGVLPPHSPPHLYLQQGNVYSAPLLFAIILYHFLHPSFFCCFLLTSHLSHVGAHFSSPFCPPWLHFSKFVSSSIFSLFSSIAS